MAGLARRISGVFRPPLALGYKGATLFGPSCGGKSHLLSALAGRFRGRFVEVDRTQYWRDDLDPERWRPTLERLIPAGATGPKRALRTALERLPDADAAQRLTLVPLFEACLTRGEFVATCGNLPWPGDPIYALLARSLGIELHHCLLLPPERVHRQRLAERGRGDDPTYLSEFRRYAEGRHRFEALLDGSERPEAVVAALRCLRGRCS